MIHETDKGWNRNALHHVNHLINLGVITDGLLNGLTTVAGLTGLIDSAANVSEQDSNVLRHAKEAFTKAKNVGAITDAQVATVGGGGGGTRIAALRAIFTANDSDLVGTETRSFAF